VYMAEVKWNICGGLPRFDSTDSVSGVSGGSISNSAVSSVSPLVSAILVSV